MSTPYPPTGPENPDPTGGQAPTPGSDPYPYPSAQPQQPPAPPVYGSAPQQPAYGEAPAYPGGGPAYPTAGSAYPGGDPAYGMPDAAEKKAASTRTLSIIGLVTAIIPCTSLIGLVLGIVALVRGRGLVRTGKGMAIAAVIVSAVWLVLGVALVALGFFGIWQTCSDLGPGEHVVDGITYTCGDNF